MWGTFVKSKSVLFKFLIVLILFMLPSQLHPGISSPGWEDLPVLPR